MRKSCWPIPTPYYFFFTSLLLVFSYSLQLHPQLMHNAETLVHNLPELCSNNCVLLVLVWDLPTKLLSSPLFMQSILRLVPPRSPTPPFLPLFVTLREIWTVWTDQSKAAVLNWYQLCLSLRYFTLVTQVLPYSKVSKVTLLGPTGCASARNSKYALKWCWSSTCPLCECNIVIFFTVTPYKYFTHTTSILVWLLILYQQNFLHKFTVNCNVNLQMKQNVKLRFDWRAWNLTIISLGGTNIWDIYC